MIGINHYGKAAIQAYAASDLNGPKNDVALFKSLLTSAYGAPDDNNHFQILLDGQATHSNIAAAFQTQLIDKAKSDPDSVYLFYFSGHGSLAVDNDGDEGDGYDETLVAYDSRSADGSDIRDDEIETWLTELKKYTQNIVLIFDSCHSGTVSKAPGLKARRAPLDDRQKPNASLPSKTTQQNRALDGPQKAVSIISGSLAEEVSNEDEIQTTDGPKYHGLLTYALVQSLAHDPQLTYRQAVIESEQIVHKYAPSQHPQAEGDIDRTMFGGIGERQTPYIPILSATKDEISVSVGQSQGVQTGALLAIYSSGAKTLEGETDKIAEAIVKKAGLASSDATFVNNPIEDVTTASKVRIISPYSTRHRIGFSLSPPPDGYALGQPAAQEIKERLKDSALLEAIDDPNAARMFVGLACMDGKVPSDPRSSPSCEKSLYIGSADQPDAIHGFHVPAEPQEDAVAAVVKALENFARQENLRGLANRTSPLAGLVEFTFVDVDVEMEGEQAKIVNRTPVSDMGTVPIKVDDSFQFEVTNKTDQDLYFSIIGLGSSGAVYIVNDTPSGEKLQPNVPVLTKPVLKAGPPYGLESYVLLATTTPTNVSFLAEPGVKAAGSGPLAQLLDGLANPSFKDATKQSALDLNSWVTSRIDLNIHP